MLPKAHLTSHSRMSGLYKGIIAAGSVKGTSADVDSHILAILVNLNRAALIKLGEGGILNGQARVGNDCPTALCNVNELTAFNSCGYTVCCTATSPLRHAR